jgi:hypothetical protein
MSPSGFLVDVEAEMRYIPVLVYPPYFTDSEGGITDMQDFVMLTSINAYGWHFLDFGIIVPAYNNSWPTHPF